MAAVLLAACGGEDDSAGETAPPPTTSAPAVASTDAPTATTDLDDHGHHHDHHDHGSGEHRAGEHGEVVEVEDALARLVIADAARPEAVTIDLDGAASDAVDDAPRHTVELAAPAGLSSSISDDGRFLYAAHDGAVTIVDGGVWSEAHGDHFHHFATAPTAIGVVEGERPTHLISHGGTVALWFDGTGSAVLLDEHELADGHLHEGVEWTSDLAHHGFAVPYGDVVVTTNAAEEGAMPDTVVVDGDGGPLAEHDCVQTHGEATWAGGVAAACRDGVLVLDDDDWSATFVPSPSTDDVDPYGYGPARAWALTADSSGDRLLGAFGAQHVLVVDAVDASAKVIDLGQPVAMFGVTTTDDPDELLVLTTDGALRTVDLATSQIGEPVAVLGAFTEGAGEGDAVSPYRQVVVHDGTAYVTDPEASRVMAVDLTTDAARPIELGFVPSFVGVLNGG